MRRGIIALGVIGLLTAAAVVGATTLGPGSGTASSHREAPLIAEDPSADLTDLYAFRSPDKPNTVTILANVIPGEDPAAGPNWYTFSPNARYNLKIDTNGDARPNVTYQFRFRTKTGPFFLGDTAQPFTVTRIAGGRSRVVARGTTPPNNIGPRSTPSYRSLAAKGVVPVAGGGSAFAGQRDDPFFGDIGAIFDLVAIRKGTGNMGGGKDFFAGYGVHTFGVQVPIAGLSAKNGIIGVWSSVDRRKVTTRIDLGRAHFRRLDPGQPPGQPARQRGRHSDRPQGSVERPPAVAGGSLPEVLRRADPRGGHQPAVQAGCPREGSRRPRRGPAHRRPAAQLHERAARRGPPPEPHHPGDEEPEPDGGARGRQPGLAERPAPR